ncbi:MAG: hypothetical protein Q8L87_15430, partial [Anaerolineales bacterium]|nr:hypothetical protein [Anaerolineales bacterium]
FYGGAKWGEQLKLALPKFTQTRSAEYSSSDTDAQAYAEPSATGEIMPLHYVSNAPVGVKFEKGGQMKMWDGG